MTDKNRITLTKIGKGRFHKIQSDNSSQVWYNSQKDELCSDKNGVQ